MTFLLKETFLNVTEKAIWHKQTRMEEAENIGALYRDLKSEYGGHVTKMYLDTKDGQTKQVGWVFRKRDTYDDGSGTFLRETWVEVFEAPAPPQHYAFKAAA